MTNPARAERLAFCDAALAAGPDAPTLCSPWTVADLVAHVILRESRPDLAAGIAVPPLAGRLERAQTALARRDFRGLLEQVRTGPPFWHPARLAVVDDAVNLAEFFVHTEDIRRPAGLEPRPADATRDRALAGALKRLGALMYRKAPVGVTLHADGAHAHVVHKPTDLGSVIVRGPVSEVFLVSYGRQGAARASVDGPERAVTALRSATLGLA